MYEYNAAAKITGGREIDVSAHVELFCESGQPPLSPSLLFLHITACSILIVALLMFCVVFYAVGRFGDEMSVRSCISVKNVAAKLSDEEDKE